MSDAGAVGPPDAAGPGLRLRVAELRADVRAGLVCLLAALVAGVGVGVVWSQVAPGRRVAVVGTQSAPLSGQDDHVFDATAVFVLLVVVLGVLVGGLAWRSRAHRGPVLLVAAVLGSLLAAFVAAKVGGALTPAGTGVDVLLDRAEASASGTPGPPVPARLTTLPATLGTTWAVVAGGLAAALGYLLPAIALGEEGMDRAGD